MHLLVKMALKTPQHDHTVDIKPAVQAEFARQAAARGSVIESYVASRLEEAVHLPARFDKERAQAAAARIRGIKQRGHARRLDDQAVDCRRASVSRLVLDNTVTMAWCFASEATDLSETLLRRLSDLTDSALVPSEGADCEGERTYVSRKPLGTAH